MKRRYFLRGLGAGVILSAVVSAVVINQNDLSDAEIRTRARKLGMTEQESSSEKPKETQKVKKEEKDSATEKIKITEEPTASPVQSTTAPPNTQKYVSADKKKETKAPELTKAPEVTKEPVVTKKPQKVQKKYISVSIEAGMWSDEISMKFKELGLVDNAERFDDFLCDNGYASMIKVGVYQIPTNATYTEIASIITK